MINYYKVRGKTTLQFGLTVKMFELLSWLFYAKL